MVGAAGVDDDPLAGILPRGPDRQRTIVRLPGFVPVPEDARLLDLEQIGEIRFDAERDHAFDRIQRIVPDRNLLCDADAHLAQPLHKQRAVRIPVRTGNTARKQRPVGFLRFRRQRLQQLAVDGQAPAGQDARVLEEDPVRQLGLDVPVRQGDAEGRTFHQRDRSGTHRPGRRIGIPSSHFRLLKRIGSVRQFAGPWSGWLRPPPSLYSNATPVGSPLPEQGIWALRKSRTSRRCEVRSAATQMPFSHRPGPLSRMGGAGVSSFIWRRGEGRGLIQKTDQPEFLKHPPVLDIGCLGPAGHTRTAGASGYRRRSLHLEDLALYRPLPAVPCTHRRICAIAIGRGISAPAPLAASVLGADVGAHLAEGRARLGVQRRLHGSPGVSSPVRDYRGSCRSRAAASLAGPARGL